MSYNGIFIIVLTMYKNMTEGGGRGYSAGAPADDSTIIKVSGAKTGAGVQKKAAAAAKQAPAKAAKDAKKAEKAPDARPAHKRTSVPLSFYWFKDAAREFMNHKNFPDSVLSVFAMASAAIAFPFYPLPVLILLVAFTFFIARLHPLLGLMALLFITLPMVIYQAPLLAWLLMIFISAALLLGYKHYRSITLLFALMMLPLSYLGFAFEIPTFLMGLLYIGFRRGLAITTAAMLLIPMLSGLTGIPISGPIVYSTAGFAASVSGNQAMQYLKPALPAASIAGFYSSWSSAFRSFFSFRIAGEIFSAFGLAGRSVAYSIEFTLLQLFAWLIVIFTVSSYVSRSRSPYKGAEASAYEFVILAVWLVGSYAAGVSANWLSMLGFVITPLGIFALEFGDVQIVRTLEVMKQDFFGKFEGIFEEMGSNTRETLNDVADYAETKKEITQALLAPIERRDIASAYNIKPPKGILLFGPPGTGKTLIMRAISNELRARFLYVKTSNLLSPYTGESSHMIAKIFETAAKYRPTVLFFDEIDAIAGKRSMQESEGSRQMLSTLLTEMDGFQKMEGVVIVGSTNMPQALDPGILRPGRFDKIIYMPLPNKEGREEIFRYYSKKYPMSHDVDFARLAEASSRYSGADIANACHEAAKQVSEIALEKIGVLKIETQDILKVIKASKASTSLAQIAEYERFRMDYERRMNPEPEERKGGVDDVVGLEDAKKALREAIEIPMLHPDLIRKYDIRNINGILLFGPPGTGKTMLMKSIEESIGEFRMISISGSDISREGLEKAVETIKEIFDRAKENAPSIIFIDEIDSLVPDRERSNELGVELTGEFLREMDSAKEGRVLVIGATNRPDAIDPALLRPGRFDKLIFAPPPGREERVELFRRELGDAPGCDKVDVEKIAAKTQGYTGADIANICRQVKIEALEHSIDNPESAEVTTDDVEKAVEATRPSAPSIVIGRYLTFLSSHSRN